MAFTQTKSMNKRVLDRELSHTVTKAATTLHRLHAAMLLQTAKMNI
jgi:hypothetical protein